MYLPFPRYWFLKNNANFWKKKKLPRHFVDKSGDFYQNGGHFYFDLPSHATWFILREF